MRFAGAICRTNRCPEYSLSKDPGNGTSGIKRVRVKQLSTCVESREKRCSRFHRRVVIDEAAVENGVGDAPALIIDGDDALTQREAALERYAAHVALEDAGARAHPAFAELHRVLPGPKYLVYLRTAAECTLPPASVNTLTVTTSDCASS
jgi:hypothetical protein